MNSSSILKSSVPWDIKEDVFFIFRLVHCWLDRLLGVSWLEWHFGIGIKTYKNHPFPIPSSVLPPLAPNRTTAHCRGGALRTAGIWSKVMYHVQAARRWHFWEILRVAPQWFGGSTSSPSFQSSLAFIDPQNAQLPHFWTKPGSRAVATFQVFSMTWPHSTMCSKPRARRNRRVPHGWPSLL